MWWLPLIRSEKPSRNIRARRHGAFPGNQPEAHLLLHFAVRMGGDTARAAICRSPRSSRFAQKSTAVGPLLRLTELRLFKPPFAELRFREQRLFYLRNPS